MNKNLSPRRRPMSFLDIVYHVKIKPVIVGRRAA